MLQVFEEEKVFHLYTDTVSYLFHVENDSVRNLHFGGAIDGRDAASLLSYSSHSSFDKDIRAEREEYPLWNGHGFHLPCLQASGEPGRALFCAYEGYEGQENEDGDRLDILLRDPNMGLHVRLRYQLYRDSGVLARSAVLTADKALCLNRVMSASVSLPPMQESRARWLTGKWAGEFQVTEGPVNTGILTLQSKRGITGPHFNPSIALAEPSADETRGSVWFGALAYSGNWSIQVEKSIFGNTHVVAGIHDFDFEMPLKPGQTFETPAFYTGFTKEGFGGMSRVMHAFVRRHIMPPAKLRPVLYNSWEATTFDVQVDEQKKLAERAAKIGCELFVVDDGWFGERHSDNAGLGDWYVNTQKFPGGLQELIDHVKGLGMDFGIWVEPESVNPDSDLYRNHPDWIYRYPTEEPVQLRNQYLLNMSLPEVQEYLKTVLHNLLRDNDIAFIKWDMNRVITDPYSIPDGAGKALWYSHVQAVYALWEDIRKSFPHVEMETCSGGGGRIDLGILRYAEQSWPSDNTDPYTRLQIQEGFTQFYPANAMICWVTESPAGDQWARRSAAYRFHSAMCGGLGIGSDIGKLNKEELEEYAFWVSRYKQWRHIVQQGQLYRLISPSQLPYGAVEYVSADKQEALLFLFTGCMPTDKGVPPVRLQGLHADTRYALSSGEQLQGSTLMQAGIPFDIDGDFASTVIHLKKI